MHALALLTKSAVLKQAAACRARKQVAEIFKKVIENRRATGTKEDDVLQVRVQLSLLPLCACRRSRTGDSSSVAAIQSRPDCTTGPWQKPQNRTARLGLAASPAACFHVLESPASLVLLLPLQVFIDAKYKNAYGGRHLNDEEITGMLIAGLFAGQHTSSITSAWTGLTMVANQVG